MNEPGGMFLWVPFISYVIIMSFTPGPNNIMSMNNAKNAGFRKGLIFNYGIFTGFFFAIILCLVFSAALYNLIPRIQLPMKILGASYIIYLIVKSFIPAKKNETVISNGTFFVGAALQLINPKLMIYGITAMSSFILPHFREIPTLLFFSFFLAFVGFAATVAWALFGSLFSLMFNKHRTVLNIIMAVLLLYCAVSLFL